MEEDDNVDDGSGDIGVATVSVTVTVVDIGCDSRSMTWIDVRLVDDVIDGDVNAESH